MSNDIEQLPQHVIEAMRDSVAPDPLAQYTARDLVKALHWTSKDDLNVALADENHELDHLWDSLTQADKGLQQFYAHQLAGVIKVGLASQRRENPPRFNQSL